jgi:hypothetical protein
MHRTIVVCVILNGSVKRCIGCDTSGRINLCVKFDGLFGGFELGIRWLVRRAKMRMDSTRGKCVLVFSVTLTILLRPTYHLSFIMVLFHI